MILYLPGANFSGHIMNKVADELNIVARHDLRSFLALTLQKIRRIQTIFSFVSAVPSGHVREAVMSAVRR
jgi:hypothetical protein